jgi:antitoxin (DNA-binding transcriptional repressor) of toxin-antitoxin stability system
MKTITMLEFRKNAAKIIRWSRQGQRMTVTYRGKPVMKIEPILPQKTKGDDPFYSLGLMADDGGGTLGNDAMDKLIYET